MLDNRLLGLTHEEQQKAVEKIQQLMAEGIAIAQAVAIVAQELREEKNNFKDSF